MQFPDPYYEVLEQYFPFFIIYGLVLLGGYIIWSVLEWLIKRRTKKNA